MKAILSYEETLDLAESFMEKSGIRTYCSDTCKGFCCGGCFKSKKACHKNEGRRLACSTFICYDLRRRVLTQTQQNTYGATTNTILDAMGDCESPYFEPTPKELRDCTKFNINDLKFITNTRTPMGIRNKLPKQNFMKPRDWR